MRHAHVETMTGSPEETELLGERIAGSLLREGPDAGPAVLLLHGPLGAGKTCLVRGLARGLGSATPPRSPTFALHLTYHGRRVLHHLDLYRLSDARLEDLGLEDLFSEPGVVAVEWGERLGPLTPKDALHITLTPEEGGTGGAGSGGPLEAFPGAASGGERRRVVLDGPAVWMPQPVGGPA